MSQVLGSRQAPGDGIRGASETAVVILTMPPHDGHLLEALSAGGVGYVIQGLEPERLSAVLERVLRGEIVLPSGLVSRVIGKPAAAVRARHAPAPREPDRLTGREWEVLELLREGLSTAQIAERLFVSRVTVRTHVAAIVRKLRVPDRIAAVQLTQDG
jgi:DNA-binding NarL/FixJ family response regulator